MTLLPGISYFPWLPGNQLSLLLPTSQSDFLRFLPCIPPLLSNLLATEHLSTSTRSLSDAFEYYSHAVNTQIFTSLPSLFADFYIQLLAQYLHLDS